MNPFYYSRRFFTKKQSKKIVLALIISLVQQSIGHTGLLHAKEAKAEELNSNPLLITATISAPEKTEQIDNEVKTVDTTKIIKKIVKSNTVRAISAYNAGDVNQCDGDPCTAANGENICEALEKGYKRCAANFVPFGTILEIEGYGECMVVDRMNSRYPNNVDIAMKYSEKKAALAFGRRNLNVKIISVIKTDTELALK